MPIRYARSKDPRTVAALAFSAELVARSGHLPMSAVEELRAADFSDGEIAEIVAAVVLNIYRSWFNVVAGTDIDFPLVRSQATAGSTTGEVVQPSDM
jgi:alkylhydroperoxidase family enzyme